MLRVEISLDEYNFLLGKEYKQGKVFTLSIIDGRYFAEQIEIANCYSEFKFLTKNNLIII